MTHNFGTHIVALGINTAVQNQQFYTGTREYD